MTQDDALQQWQTGARKELHSAELLCNGGEYEAALFHCHLAVEKALKGLYIAKQDTEPPYSHDLVRLAEIGSAQTNDEERQWLQELSQFVVEARCWDPDWAREKATERNAREWLKRTALLLDRFTA